MTPVSLLILATAIFLTADRLDRNYRQKWLELESESIRLLDAGLSREFILVGSNALRRAGRLSLALGTALGLLFSSPLFFLTTAGALFALPGAFLRFYRGRRRRRFQYQLGVSLPQVSTILHAGHTLERALETLSRNHSAPLGQEFALVLKERALGRPLEESLDGLRSRIQSRDLDVVVQAIILSRRLGSNLAEMIDQVADTIQARATLADRLASLTAQGRAQGWVATLMPIFLMLILQGLSPSYVAPLYRTDAGRVLLTYCTVSLVAGGLWIHRIARAEPME